MFKADDNGLAFDQGGSPEITGWPQHQLGDLLVLQSLFLQVDFDDFLAFSRKQLASRPEQLFGFLELMRFLLGVDFGFCLYFVLCKKLLRFSTGFSARAMIAPVDFRHFHSPCLVGNPLKS